MLKKEMDSLLWKMNYKDIRWVQTSSSVSSDMAEVSVKLNLLETRLDASTEICCRPWINLIIIIILTMLL